MAGGSGGSSAVRRVLEPEEMDDASGGSSQHVEGVSGWGLDETGDVGEGSSEDENIGGMSSAGIDPGSVGLSGMVRCPAGLSLGCS